MVVKLNKVNSALSKLRHVLDNENLRWVHYAIRGNAPTGPLFKVSKIGKFSNFRDTRYKNIGYLFYRTKIYNIFSMILNAIYVWNQNLFIHQLRAKKSKWDICYFFFLNARI